MTRGLRLNNPGNIRHGDSWRGLSAAQDDPSFCSFIAPVYGLRAMVKILLAYRARGQMTIRTIIGAWAPAVENDTRSYVDDVAARCDVEPDQVINVQDRATCLALLKAIVRHENGSMPYADNVINDAMTLAGLA